MGEGQIRIDMVDDPNGWKVLSSLELNEWELSNYYYYVWGGDYSKID